MGVKKPAVIAKTAKKRGRPVGSKNKPKTLDGLPVGTKLKANDFYKRLENSKTVDWEKIAKHLEVALAAQINEADAYRKLWEAFQDKIVISESLSIWRRLKLLFTGKI